MERELWPLVYRGLRGAAREVSQKYVRYQPWAIIAAVLRWAAIHDRPVSWACDPRNWSTTRLRPAEIPSASTVSRRAARGGFAVFLNHLAARLKGDGPPAWVLTIGGMPPPVGRCSKDPDARGGYLGKGYKLHAIWGDKPLPEAWAVTAVRRYEGAVAEGLLTQVAGKGVLLGDGNYEASRLYDAAAGRGYQLLAHPDPRTPRGGTGTRARTGPSPSGGSGRGWGGGCTGSGRRSSGCSGTPGRSGASSGRSRAGSAGRAASSGGCGASW